MMTQSITKPWTKDEDIVLVEIALRHIRQGLKMEDAWKEAEEKIGRTSGACKFRWNGNLSKIYDQSIEQAKLQRSIHNQKSKGEKEMSPEINLPKNRPVQVTDNQEKAPRTEEKKRANIEWISSNAKEPAKEDASVKETSTENPFARIRKFATKMEKEFESQLSHMKELEKLASALENTINDLKKEIASKDQLLKEKDRQIESYKEIAELIQQFNQANK